MNVFIKNTDSQDNLVLFLDVQPGTLSLHTGIVAHDGNIAGEAINPAFADLPLKAHHLWQIQLEELWQKQDWKDACIWGFLLNADGKHSGLVNFLADSYPTRRDPSDNLNFIWKYSPVKMIVPFAEADFTEMSYYAFATDASKFVSNLPFNTVTEAHMIQHRWNSLPTLAIEGASTMPAGGTASFTLNSTLDGVTFDHPLDIDIEHINGYVPNTRVRMQGTASFRVQALGLEAGDSIKLKAGFRYLGSRAEKTIRII